MRSKAENSDSFWKALLARAKAFWKTLPGKVAAAVVFIGGVVGILNGLKQLGVGESNAKPLSGIEVRATGPSSYEGPCPRRIKFRGEISVAEGSGIVEWRLVIFGTDEFPVRKLRFSEPGAKTIEEEFLIASSGVAPIRFDVQDPESATAEIVDFRSECT